MECLRVSQIPRVERLNRGKDLRLLKVYKRIEDGDNYTVWYTQDFLDLGKSRTIRLVLKRLTDLGYITEFNDSYPKFWKLKRID